MMPPLIMTALLAGIAAFLFARATVFIESRAVRSFLTRRAQPLAEIVFFISATMAVLLWLLRGQDPDTRFALGIIVAAIIWTVRPMIEDVTSGWFVRMEGLVETGRWVGLAGLAEGRVQKVGFRAVVVETARGDMVRIPLRQFAAHPVTSADTSSSSRAHSFTLEIRRTRPLAPLLAEIPAAAMTSPWSSTTRPPEVTVRAETETHYIIDVTTWALDPSFAADIEAAVRETVGS